MARTLKLTLEVDDKGSLVVKNASGKMKRSINDIEKTSKNVTSKMSNQWVAVGAAMMAAVSAQKVISAFKSIVDYGDQLGKTSDRLGVSAENLDKLIKLGEYADVTFSELNTAFRIMARNTVMAAKGTGEAAEAFERLGISTDEFMKMSPMEQFKKLAESIMGLESSTERAALAQQLLGRSGTQLLTIFPDLEENMKNVNSQWDDEKAKNAEKFNDQLTTMKNDFVKLGEAIMNKVLPPLTRFFSQIEQDYITRHTRAMIEYQNQLTEVNDELAELNSYVDADEKREAKREAKIKQLEAEKQSLLDLIHVEKTLVDVRKKADEQKEKKKSKTGTTATGTSTSSKELDDFVRKSIQAASTLEDTEMKHIEDLKKAGERARKIKIDITKQEYEDKLEQEERMFQATQDRINAELELINAATDREAEMYNELGDEITSSMKDSFKSVMLGTKSIEDALVDMLDRIAEAFLDFALSMIDSEMMMTLMKGIGGLFGSFGGSGLGNVSTIRGGMGGGYGFAEGGIVSGPHTGYPVTLHGTEAVIPLDKGGGGGGGNTLIIQAMDARSFTEFARRNPEAFATVMNDMANKGHSGFRGAVKKAVQ